jgi:hypothetical protein
VRTKADSTDPYRFTGSRPSQFVGASRSRTRQREIEYEIDDTGGSPKKALIKTTSRRPQKGKMASAVPRGKLIAVAAAVAIKLTLIDNATISRKLSDSSMML